ncbi:MAG: transposase, partial [Geminicoccaceae bacterium]
RRATLEACRKAAAASFRRRATLEACRKAAAARVAQLRAELAADPVAASRRQAGARARAARERQAPSGAGRHPLLRRRIGRRPMVERALAAATALGRERAARAGKDGSRATAQEPRASTTDPQARVTKMADGGYRPAFNLQLASDTKSGLIAAVELDAGGSDQGRLGPMSDRLAERYGIRPAQHLADGGDTKLGDIARLEEAGCQIFAPPPTPRDPSRDRHAPLPDDPPGVAAWRRRMGSDAARAIYRLRAATAECANAQARNRGLIRFTVRGIAKAKAVALWFALAHNMARGWRLTTA